MDSRHLYRDCSDPVTNEGNALGKPRVAEPDQGAEQKLDELEEEVCRLQQLVCELLCINQQLRLQILNGR